MAYVVLLPLFPLIPSSLLLPLSSSSPPSPSYPPLFSQAEGFHGELEEFLQWLRRTESQLSAAKPTGGLPETAREQLQQHLVMKRHITLERIW